MRFPPFPRNRKVVLTAVALVLLGGGAGALAATQLSSSPRQQYLNDVAKHLNVTPAALTSAMKAAAIDQIQAALKAGKLTQAQASKLEQAINNGAPLPFGGPGFPGRGGRFGPGGPGGFGPPGLGMGIRGGPFALGSAALKYLGISAATLKSDIAAGKSLAQIADSTPGKSAAGLESALVDARKADLDKAVANKMLTAAQETKLLATLQQRIHALVNMSFKNFKGGLLRKFKAPGLHGRFRGFFFGPNSKGGPPVPQHPSFAPPPPAPRIA